MDFWHSLGILARRWYIVVPGIVLTTVLSIALYTNTAPTYRANGTVVFYAPGKLTLPVATADDPAPTAQRSNPFLGFDGSIGVTSEIVSRAVVAPAAINAITGKRSATSFTVEPDINARGPIIQLTADAPTGPDAVATLNRGIAQVTTTLDQQQAAVGAPKDTWVRVAVLRADRSASAVAGNRIKSAGAVFVLGIALSITAAFLVDALMRAGRKRGTDGLQPVPVPSDGRSSSSRAS